MLVVLTVEIVTGELRCSVKKIRNMIDSEPAVLIDFFCEGMKNTVIVDDDTIYGIVLVKKVFSKIQFVIM